MHQIFHQFRLLGHCKDIRKDILEKSLNNDATFRQAFLDGAFTVPGDGCIDYIPFLKVQNSGRIYVYFLVILTCIYTKFSI